MCIFPHLKRDSGVRCQYRCVVDRPQLSRIYPDGGRPVLHSCMCVSSRDGVCLNAAQCNGMLFVENVYTHTVQRS